MSISPDHKGVVWNRNLPISSFAFAILLVFTTDRVVVAQESAEAADPPEQEFLNRDRDENQMLSLDEFTSDAPEEELPRLRRDFSVADWNDDNMLSSAEFLGLRGSPEGEVPDPIRKAAASLLTDIESQWESWDTDGNGELNETEFTNTKLDSAVPGMEHSSLKRWDLDHNGTLSQEEAVRVVQVAYGLISPQGLALRDANGVVVRMMSFRYCDVDHDGFITAEEFHQRRGNTSEEDNKKLVAQHDQNEDGKLSPAEARDYLLFDTLTRFLTSDADLDGLLSDAELLKAAEAYQQSMVPFLVPAFDADEDGKLNYLEYRLTPLANYDEPWHEKPYDASEDGYLSFSELTWGRDWEACAIRAELFSHLDLDDDGRLSLGEFNFNINASKVPVQIVLNDRDQNHDEKISLEEFTANAPESELPRLRRDFTLADWNADGGLSAKEFLGLMGSPDGEVPDPIRQAAAPLLADIEKKWQSWDADSNGSLHESEFNKSTLSSAVPGMENSKLSAWDLNQNETLEQDEAARVVQVAYGLLSPEGLTLRDPHGVVFRFMGFRYFDMNDDGFVDVKELQQRRKLDEDAARELVNQYDENSDDKLTPKESKDFMQFNTLARFLSSDADLDGLLSAEELVNAAEAYQQSMVPFLVPAFDTDEDGNLNYLEYRLTPLANYDEPWHEMRRDANDDGYLSFADFTWGRDWEACAIRAELFGRLDSDGDQQLSRDEWIFRTNYHDPQREFQLADRDQDGQLTLEEYQLETQPDDVQRRDFRLFDRDSDGRLTYQEYLSIPSRTNLSQRLFDWDPVMSLVSQEIIRLKEKLATVDEDQDLALTDDEFRNGRFSRDVPGLELSTFRDWDLNDDSIVTMNEVRQVINAAYGVKRLDGLPFRDRSGIVHNAMHFEYVDRDQDKLASRSEYLEKNKSPDAEDKFQTADQNSDGNLDFGEWIENPTWLIDPIADFLRYDTDNSGDLSHSEVMKGTPEWQHNITSHYTSAFDDDGDGQLSLAEYRFAPMSNPLTLWHHVRSDRDGDGYLSFSEFHLLSGTELVSLARVYFDRFDRNHDGKLSLDEFAFNINIQKVPPEIAFHARDTNEDENLSLDELLGDLKSRTDQGAQTQIGRLEEMFVTVDTDEDRQLTLAEYREGHRLLNNPQRGKGKDLSLKIARRNQEDSSGNSNRLWILIAFNVLLIGGVGWYVLFKK